MTFYIQKVRGWRHYDIIMLSGQCLTPYLSDRRGDWPYSSRLSVTDLVTLIWVSNRDLLWWACVWNIVILSWFCWCWASGDCCCTMWWSPLSVTTHIICLNRHEWKIKVDWCLEAYNCEASQKVISRCFFYRLLEDIRKASWRVVGVWVTEAGRLNTCRDKSSFNGAWNVAQSWTWRSLLCRLWASREPLAAASHSLYERRRLDRTGLWFPHYVCYPQQRYSNAANSNKQLTRRRPLPVAPWQNKSTSRQKVQSHVIVKKCDLCH